MKVLLIFLNYFFPTHRNKRIYRKYQFSDLTTTRYEHFLNQSKDAYDLEKRLKDIAYGIVIF